jgi:hypothetical protein
MPSQRAMQSASVPSPVAAGRLKAIALLLCVSLATLTGCGNIEPWVKPYERQALADPIMSFDPNPVSSAYTDHVFEAREGARGALGGSGGGCGCN